MREKDHITDKRGKGRRKWDWDWDWVGQIDNVCVSRGEFSRIRSLSHSLGSWQLAWSLMMS